MLYLNIVLLGILIFGTVQMLRSPIRKRRDKTWDVILATPLGATLCAFIVARYFYGSPAPEGTIFETLVPIMTSVTIIVWGLWALDMIWKPFRRKETLNG
jgi:amino acid transporter